jgi:HEAT repeat protein
MSSSSSANPPEDRKLASPLSRRDEQSLHHANSNVRLEAVQRLGNMGALGFGDLERVIEDERPTIRARAAEGLGRQQLPAAAVPVLKRALRDANAHVRIAAATALGNLGAEAHSAIPELVRSLADVNLIFSRLAAQALSRIGQRAVPGLIAALLNRDSNVRREAAWALGEIGPAAAEALPSLEAALPNAPVIPATTITDMDNTVVCKVEANRPGQMNAEARVRNALKRAIDRIRVQSVTG